MNGAFGSASGCKQVPPFDVEPLAAQFGEARDAPYLAADAVLAGQHLGRRLDLAQDRARAEQTHLQSGLAGLDVAQLIGAAENALFRPFRHCRMGVILVQGRDVVINVVLIDEHPFQAGVDDHREFVAVSRVVGHAIGNGRGENMAVAVLVLQTLAVKSRPARRAADQEAACAHVARRPGEIADALEAEHRVIDIERYHRHVRRRVGRARGDERGHRARLVDPFLKNLSFRILAIIHELIGVLRPIELPHLAENANLPKQPLHAEGPALVGDDRNHMRADVLVAQERGQNSDEGHGGRNLSSLGGCFQHRVEGGERRNLERFALAPTRRQIAAKRRPPLVQIARSLRCSRRSAGTEPCRGRRRRPGSGTGRGRP